MRVRITLIETRYFILSKNNTMKFNSQICTTKEQSERLLALGLKKETADMCWVMLTLHGTPVTYPAQESWLDYSIINDNHFPSWSLHRLIEMMPNEITQDDCNLILGINATCVYYADDEYAESFKNFEGNLYECVVKCIEWLIKEGYFNKEYLEE